MVRSRIEPMKKIARSLRAHRPLILNWFRARKLIAFGAVEGFNNKLKLTTRRSYGFRVFRVGGACESLATPPTPSAAQISRQPA
jgi:transposase